MFDQVLNTPLRQVLNTFEKLLCRNGDVSLIVKKTLIACILSCHCFALIYKVFELYYQKVVFRLKFLSFPCNLSILRQSIFVDTFESEKIITYWIQNFESRKNNFSSKTYQYEIHAILVGLYQEVLTSRLTSGLVQWY